MELNTSVSELIVNGMKYVKVDHLQQPCGNLKIVILQRGHVMVGYLERDGSECKLRSAAVIRQWGTTRGLGELAMNGPLPNTKLDKCGGLVEFDYLTVIACISCEGEKWKNVL